MMAIRFEPNERNLATLYDRPSPGLRFSRKNLMAFAAVGLLYAGFGAAVMSYKITHEAAVITESPGIIITSEPRRPKIEVAQKPTVSKSSIHKPALHTETEVEKLDARPAEEINTGPTDILKELPKDPPNPPAFLDPRGPLMIKNPAWVLKPTAAQLGRVYPDRAVDKDVSGAATLLCSVAADGSMVGCTVIDEAPKGWRFGQAALAAARYFKMSPRTVDGQVVEGAKVRIPIVFTLG